MLSAIRQTITQFGVTGLARMVWLRLAAPHAGCLSLAAGLVEKKSGLEVGGPSQLFSDTGFLPLYKSVGSLDNVNFSNQTVWENTITAGKTFHYHAQKEPGTQFIAEAGDLKPINDGAYDFVLTSHTLEHSANPLKVLAELKRVLKPGGVLVILVPHHEGTFDHKRPVTKLAHLIEDQANQTPESDLTHLPEILQLHDLDRDPGAGTREAFEARCRENAINRCMHQHVFDSRLLMAVLDKAGFQILAGEARLPFHVIGIAQKATVQGTGREVVDNARFLSGEAEHIRLSPFSTDRPPCS